ncbi:hypothetical protein RRG08_032181 [Elysia crispata]|uniref:Uncharacterized protein n=1 Tax=Elysia crispata TaxID=231223 RepID=A0AAE1ABV7_9GAST|nr:hypothetical protein RRG08_032181 [Elysia crispata]
MNKGETGFRDLKLCALLESPTVAKHRALETKRHVQSSSSLMLDIRYVFLGALHFDILRATAL